MAFFFFAVHECMHRRQKQTESGGAIVYIKVTPPAIPLKKHVFSALARDP